MQKEILKYLNDFETPPFLFVGSGLSRRYLGLEDWESLLRHFAIEVTGKEFAFEIYHDDATEQEHRQGIYPKIAQLIERDFKKLWYSDARYAEERTLYKEQVFENKVSPFKIAIAEYINAKSVLVDNYAHELELLKQVSKKSISGSITTNYDMLLETCFEDYETYVGQEQLLVSPIQGIGEIYKIHGSCSNPQTIIINERDYKNFESENAYLTAKLLTIFLEHPIIFIGYSLTDINIQKILKSIVHCLSQEQLDQLSRRLIFIEWSPIPGNDEIIDTFTTLDNGRELKMTKIVLYDFSLLYKALLKTRAKYSVPILRRLRNDVHELVQASEPTSKIQVVGIEDDTSLDNIEFVIGVGTLNNFGITGYKSIKPDDLFEDIVFDKKDFDNKLIVEQALETLYKTARGSIPFYKYISNTEHKLPDCIANSINTNYSEFLNTYLQKRKNSHFLHVNTISELQTLHDDFKCLEFIPILDLENTPLDELEEFLKYFLTEYPHILSSNDKLFTSAKINLKRIIKLYDWLKYYPEYKENSN